MQNIIYTDAGYCWTKQKKERKTGIIAYKINYGKVQMFEWSIKEIPGLQQYSNLFEFLAATFALIEAKRRGLRNVCLITDSRTCYYWLLRKKNNLRKFSEQHFKFKELADAIKIQNLAIEWRRREENLAGQSIQEKYGL